jgi:hypothetical protein
MGKGIGGHHQPNEGKSNDWITPKFIIDALGPFDLDPCMSLTQPWPTAVKGYTVNDDGFSRDWGNDRVFMNPPYGPHTGIWLEKLANHGNGIALIFARTDTKMFFDYVWRRADACLFLEGRLYFHYPDGRKAPANAGGPSVLVAYGENNVRCLKDCGLAGAFVRLKCDTP